MADRPRGMPADTPDYMAPAWLGCMPWAIGNPEIRATFEAASGLEIGDGESYVRAFIAWANEHIWGEMQ